MATKKKPAHEIRFGAVRAIIWSNVSSSGERWFTLAISRLYKDAQEKWQNANSYKLQHLVQHPESAGDQNIEFSDPRLSRLVALFELSDAPQRQAILEAVESIVGKGGDN